MPRLVDLSRRYGVFFDTVDFKSSAQPNAFHTPDPRFKRSPWYSGLSFDRVVLAAPKKTLDAWAGVRVCVDIDLPSESARFQFEAGVCNATKRSARCFARADVAPFSAEEFLARVPEGWEILAYPVGGPWTVPPGATLEVDLRKTEDGPLPGGQVLLALCGRYDVRALAHPPTA